MTKHTKQFQFGNQTVTLETGEIARQASGSVLVSIGGTVVLVTAVGNKTAREGMDFFPLTVDYQERFYAGGRIPGGFFKREGRPTERETLTSRLIDRPIRPLFPDNFRNEVQVIATVMSLDPEIPGDVPALIGTSAALALSGIPFRGPIGAARVGYADGQYLINPGPEALATSKLDLIVAGTANAVLMVESEAELLSEEVMLGAVMFGHQQMQVAIQAINELVAEVGVQAWNWQAPARNQPLVDAIGAAVGNRLAEAFQIQDKLARREAISSLRKETLAQMEAQVEANGWDPAELAREFGELEYSTMRNSVLDTSKRIDGRGLDTVRGINARAGILPRTHGSALFTRGETQAIVVTTLGTGRDAQIIDAVEGESKDPFLFHYNFPPYSVGEAGRMMGPKRREIGHGRLARRGVQAVMPADADFPYVVRVVAEVTEIKHRVDVNTREQLAAKHLDLNEVAFCNLYLDQAVAFEPYADSRELGGFILIDRQSNATVAAGTLDFALRRAANIHWQHMDADKAARAAIKHQRPRCVWFTGLSGAGKSTIANLVEKQLLAQGRHTYLLDGDNVRHGLTKDLGFTDEDRVENIRRVAEVAKLMVDAGLVVLVSFISPFRAERQMARELFEPGEFIEVFIDTPLAAAEQRDAKGLYAKARAGLISNFTGIDSAYEEPEAPELVLDTVNEPAAASAERLVELILAEHGTH